MCCDGLCQNVVGCPTEGTLETNDEYSDVVGDCVEHSRLDRGMIFIHYFSRVPMDMIPLLTSMGKVVLAMLSKKAWLEE